MWTYKTRTNGRYPSGKRCLVFVRGGRLRPYSFLHVEIGPMVFGLVGGER